ncbi:CYTH and CHAD domain-containing protein [Streptomyces sp. MJP52]|uniref:CYTH and CHAD domain-containing protein n=1 Tax=Streptomyces sp. MJP52 TaxID=2940555 RepID=UPI0024766122|nr:CYTH and CHAD domain-containing protein [Streptomyces sp. MJP52]MDH6226985.1 CHAD domain-containing protein [Streptomyces sp. MJP52]
MADTTREIERKFESRDSGLPDLTNVGGIASVVDQGVTELDAVYHDTPDLRLAASSVTLRRRTGGSSPGWHLKLPVGPDTRDEITAPLTDEPPAELLRLIRSRTRGAEVVPVVRLRSARDVRELRDAEGRLLAEASADSVHAERLAGGRGEAQWTEIEVELAEGADPALLDLVEKRFRRAGVHRSGSPSKLARALAETTPGAAAPAPRRKKPVTAGDHVLAYLRDQRDRVVALDPAVRRGLPEAVHDMRVATRRLRSALRAYRSLLDREALAPLAAELQWLTRELGVDRDQEVLDERLAAALDALPAALVTGPVRDRLGLWSGTRRGRARSRTAAVLDSRRYLDLLNSLDAVLADPPLRKAARRKPEKALAKALDKEFGRLSRLVERALALDPGPERDTALHEARKKAKRTRYAAEAARPALGKKAGRLADDAKSLQRPLGEHQDSVMSREALRSLAQDASRAGEPAFTWGVLYGREERTAALTETALPARWAEVARRSRPKG